MGLCETWIGDNRCSQRSFLESTPTWSRGSTKFRLQPTNARIQRVFCCLGNSACEESRQPNMDQVIDFECQPQSDWIRLDYGVYQVQRGFTPLQPEYPSPFHPVGLHPNHSEPQGGLVCLFKWICFRTMLRINLRFAWAIYQDLALLWLIRGTYPSMSKHSSSSCSEWNFDLILDRVREDGPLFSLLLLETMACNPPIRTETNASSTSLLWGGPALSSSSRIIYYYKTYTWYPNI